MSCPADDGNPDFFCAALHEYSATLPYGFTGRHNVVYQQNPGRCHLTGKGESMAQIAAALVCRESLLWRRMARALQQTGAYWNPELT